MMFLEQEEELPSHQPHWEQEDMVTQQPNMAHSEEIASAIIHSGQVEMGMVRHPHQEEPMLLLPLRGQASEDHVVQVPQGLQPTGPMFQPRHRVLGKVQVLILVHHSPPAQQQVQAQAPVPSEAEEVVLVVDLAVVAAVVPAVAAAVAASEEEDNHCANSLIYVSLNLTI